MKKYNKVIIAIATVVGIVALLLLSVNGTVFDLGFYQKAQAKYQVSENMGIAEEHVTNATAIALLYTKGNLDTLAYVYEVDGKNVDLYSSDDKIHMVDVQKLYFSMYQVLLILTAIVIFTSIYFMIARKSINWFEGTLIINKVTGIIAIVVALIAFFAMINFDAFWTVFHQIFFSNDLWLMDPSRDALVNLLPSGLFMDLVFKIIIRFVMMVVIVNGAAFGIRKVMIRKINKNG